ncbi:hypothetical protein D7X25_18415 [bacterium 1XD42-8]|nr:hypothetical protein D7X25_18415 [bacterium 1XD42-8]
MLIRIFPLEGVTAILPYPSGTKETGCIFTVQPYDLLWGQSRNGGRIGLHRAYRGLEVPL